MVRLDADQIVAAAWKVVDQGGVPAFTIRAIADELGVSAMAIYHHVPSKAALVNLMVEAANHEQPMAALTGDWSEDLWLLALWLRNIRQKHPAITVLHREFRVWTPGQLQITERWVDLWRQSGLDSARASVAARASTLAITGLIDEEALCDRYEVPSEDLLADAPLARAMFQGDPCPDSLFELGVRALIAGLYARLSQSDAGVRAKSLQEV